MKAWHVQLLTSRPVVTTAGLQHVVDIIVQGHCIACIFLDKHSNLVIRREGSLDIEPDTSRVGFTSPTREIIVAPRRPR